MALLERQGDDPELIGKLVQLSMSSNRLDNAIKLTRKQLKADPSSLAVRRKLATLYEWSGDPQRALPIWLEILHTHPDRQAEQRALNIAIGTYRFDEVVEVLLVKSKRGQLTDSELEQLVYS